MPSHPPMPNMSAPLDDNDRKPYAQSSNASLRTKKQQGVRIGEEELLTEQDIKDIIQTLNLSLYDIKITYLTTDIDIDPATNHTTYTTGSLEAINNIGQMLHFSRVKHAATDNSFLFSCIVANWDTYKANTFQGEHWTALLIKVNRTTGEEHPQITVTWIDSMNTLSKKNAKDALQKIIHYREETVNQGVTKIYEAFPGLPEKNLTINIINQSAQRDLWSCGYWALHNVFCALIDEKIIPQDTLNETQKTFYACDTRDKKCNFIYQLLGVTAEPSSAALSSPSRETKETTPIDPQQQLETLCNTITARAKRSYDTFFLTVDVEYDYQLSPLSQQIPIPIYVANHLYALLTFLAIEHKKSFGLSSAPKKSQASLRTKTSKKDTDKPFDDLGELFAYIERMLQVVDQFPDESTKQLTKTYIRDVFRAHILEKITDTSTDMEILSDYLHRLIRRLNTQSIHTYIDNDQDDTNFSDWLTHPESPPQNLQRAQWRLAPYRNTVEKTYSSAQDTISKRIAPLARKSLFFSPLAAWQQDITDNITETLNKEALTHTSMMQDIQAFSECIIKQHRALKHSFTQMRQDPLLKTLHYMETLLFTTAASTDVPRLLPSHLKTIKTILLHYAPSGFEEQIKHSEFDVVTTLFDGIHASYMYQSQGKKPPKEIAPFLAYCQQSYQELIYIYGQCPLGSPEKTQEEGLNNQLIQMQKKPLVYKPSIQFTAPHPQPARTNAWWKRFSHVFFSLFQWIKSLFSTPSPQNLSDNHQPATTPRQPNRGGKKLSLSPSVNREQPYPLRRARAYSAGFFPPSVTHTPPPLQRAHSLDDIRRLKR